MTAKCDQSVSACEPTASTGVNKTENGRRKRAGKTELHPNAHEWPEAKANMHDS